ncbi:MBL fold metallo-hydrolase [Novosphingobium sp. FSY-8]|uniref:MBL fold metallo-hydrolase n=2 Tax=Novosphingobium ovatum TaxID=1908523 RepID=A0ABW9X977_9SPHN|nr:MBL fold metallo-hydrolase [Novosphingobium ovatum]
MAALAMALAWALASVPAMAAGPVLAGGVPTTGWITLGTAGGPVASPTRSQPANALVTPDGVYLVDCGDGCVEQLAKAGIGLDRIKGLFISHLHYDHVGGVSALLGLRHQTSNYAPLPIYGPPGTQAMVDGLIAAMRPFTELGYGLPGVPSIDPATTVRVTEMRGGESGALNGLRFANAQNTHYSFAPGSAEDARFRSLAWRFETGGRSYVFTGDTGPSQAVIDLARGADVLISEIIDLDATVGLVQRQNPNMSAQGKAGMLQHLSHHHLPAAEVGRMAQAAGVRQLVVTHYAPSNPSAALVARMRAQIAARYHGPVVMARDVARY